MFQYTNHMYPPSVVSKVGQTEKKTNHPQHLDMKQKYIKVIFFFNHHFIICSSVTSGFMATSICAQHPPKEGEGLNGVPSILKLGLCVTSLLTVIINKKFKKYRDIYIYISNK